MTKLEIQIVVMSSFMLGLIGAASIVPLSAVHAQPVTSPNQSPAAARIAGLVKLIFANCNIDFGSINPHADGLADCSVPGTQTGDNVVATPNNGLFDALSFYAAISLDGKVRFLVHNTIDVTLPPTPTTWSLIVFHK